MGNPFTKNSSDLTVLDTKDIADPAIIERVCQIEKLGSDQQNKSSMSRNASSWWKKTKNINEPIKRNKRALFHCPPV